MSDLFSTLPLKRHWIYPMNLHLWKSPLLESLLETTTMAEIIAAGKPGKRKTQAPKVDLTPMVDLGFLLISFFVFTSTMMKPMILSLVMPKDEGPPTNISELGAVTLIATGSSIFYYEGKMPQVKAGMKQIAYQQKDALRLRLLQLKQLLIRANGNDNKLMVMIKPANDSQLSQLVAMLDEMSICDIRRYAIVDVSEEEEKIIEN